MKYVITCSKYISCEGAKEIKRSIIRMQSQEVVAKVQMQHNGKLTIAFSQFLFVNTITKICANKKNYIAQNATIKHLLVDKYHFSLAFLIVIAFLDKNKCLNSGIYSHNNIHKCYTLNFYRHICLIHTISKSMFCNIALT